ncbi:hypothetical protein SAMN05192550_1169 [Flavobacterium glycines]|uniref:DUF3037 domain-containing protein n=1 Tax=Flavobacterium glycines TaxID=551990 RepID=A0A1B9DRN6_9FLAO|nr:hypothetical protein [Flavobacterium glycines]OCB72343.1 hypothetical protein FBGL_06730 [Flavobacterium glycines]GEL09816.1 hypothetical protein FGL01_05550 [Flavobacterium glycines]SDI92499.1 hypothetical protein SAMN05192550_1169 [Flavobacterium glycines]
MKTLYSILYVTLNTTLNERVSIGVLMSNGFEHYFKYSHEKLTAFKNILDSERYNVVKNYLKSLEREIGFNLEDSNQLFRKRELRNDWINEGYITYLAKYSNNIIQFSTPKYIDIDLNSDNFKRVFEKYIFKYAEETDEIIEFNVHSKVKQDLFPKIESRVNIEMTLTSNDFENLFAPIDIDFIGINGIPVAGQTIDFEKKHYYLENDVTRFVSLTKAIELEGNNKGKYYVLGREPQKNVDKNYLLWEHIRDSDFLEFVDIDEVGIVEEYIEKHNVRPYFD